MNPISRRGVALDDPRDQARRAALVACNARIRACRLCHEAGYLVGPASTPAVFDPERDAPVPRILLIGQAPGLKGNQIAHPFEGPSGDRLRVWLDAGGIARADFWRKIHFTAVTRCYPGGFRTPRGIGCRRRPSAGSAAPGSTRSAGWSTPRSSSSSGLLAIRTVLGPVAVAVERRRDEPEVDGVRYLPLPHPSGVSRWLNDAPNVEAVARAMIELRGGSTSWTFEDAGAQKAIGMSRWRRTATNWPACIRVCSPAMLNIAPTVGHIWRIFSSGQGRPGRRRSAPSARRVAARWAFQRPRYSSLV